MNCRRTTHFLAVSTTAALLASLSACGGEAPPPKTAEAATPSTSPLRAPRMAVSSELGDIDRAAAEQTFRKLGPKFLECHRAAVRRSEYVAGDASFFLRVGQDGRVRYAYLEASSLGDHELEQCLLGVVTNASWPKPDGGEAEVRKSMSFDAGDVRPPSGWHSDRVAAALGHHDADLRRCKGPSGRFQVTAYVEPDGADGKVQAVGVAAPVKDAEEKIACIVRAVRAMRMPSPGSYAAKVTFDVD